MANNQIAVLSINDSSEGIGLVTNYAISFNQGNSKVTAHITCGVNYENSSPVFDYFVQNQPATLQLLVENMIDSRGPTDRTITFENAICRDYLETFDITHQSDGGINDLLSVITIEADSVTMGETTFPG